MECDVVNGLFFRYILSKHHQKPDLFEVYGNKFVNLERWVIKFNCVLAQSAYATISAREYWRSLALKALWTIKRTSVMGSYSQPAYKTGRRSPLERHRSVRCRLWICRLHKWNHFRRVGLNYVGLKYFDVFLYVFLTLWCQCLGLRGQSWRRGTGVRL